MQLSHGEHEQPPSTCTAVTGTPCPEPDRARTSPAALGVDVMALLAGLGLDNRLNPDRITWTGCLLFRDR